MLNRQKHVSHTNTPLVPSNRLLLELASVCLAHLSNIVTTRCLITVWYIFFTSSISRQASAGLSVRTWRGRTPQRSPQTRQSHECGKVVLTGLCCAQRNPQSTATGTQAFWLCLSPRIVCAFAAAITVTFTQKRASQWHRFGAIISRGEVWSGPLRPCFLIFMRCAMPLCGQSQPRLFQASLSTSVLPLTGELNGYAGNRKSWNFGFHSKAFN